MEALPTETAVALSIKHCHVFMMDKQFFESLGSRHGISPEVAKQVYLDICKEMAARLLANEKQSCPYFAIKPVSRPERQKTMQDGSQKAQEAKLFGRMTLKGVASAG